ncbi:MAG: hypothetical protein HY257_12670 [Chloroflexi bacterium]|nr:hypothetical protein [Chloroflexota bacterium]
MELLLFSTNPDFIQQATKAGVHGIIVDWENFGKEKRQELADTQINHDTLDDLRRVRAATQGLVVCRINESGVTTKKEVEQAIDAGADEILLPMVRTTGQVEQVLKFARDRCKVGILVETKAAVQIADELARLPLARVYLGLNDLAIERQVQNIFSAITDGTVERVKRAFRVPFGFGGLTLPERGQPIPCRLFIGEMARLDCQFSFLRRSFHRDIHGRDVAIEIPRLLNAIQFARLRSTDQVAQDRRELDVAIQAYGRSLPRAGENVLNR